MNSSAARLFLSLGLALLASACSTPGSDNLGETTTSNPSPPSLSSSQALILADGKVSRTEYEAAFAGTVSCLRKAGFTVNGPKPDRSGFLLKYDAESRGMPDGQVLRESQACEATYLNVVVERYIASHTDELRAAESSAQQKLVKCLGAKGVVVDSSDTTTSLTQLETSHLAEFAQCRGVGASDPTSS